MDHRPTIGIILAAGGSTRMGQPKALLAWSGRPWVAHHVAALGSACDRVLVVLGCQARLIAELLPSGTELVINRQWEETGMAESLALALADLPDDALAVVTPVDVPPPPAAVMHELLSLGGPVVPTAGGFDAHPVVIAVGPARAMLPAHTLREALAEAPRLELGWRDGLRNLNTPEEWADWRREQG